MKNSRANKGQFSIIAALLVSVILVTAVISTYSMVRNTPLQDSPKVLSSIGEMNNDIKRILDFTVGYYGSILQVTGNYEYAKNLTTRYLSSGLVNIARSHPEWNPSFELDSEEISNRWFMPYSYSMGSINITYSLSALGIEGVTYHTSSALSVEMLPSSDSNQAVINVTRDNSEPELGLSKENFWFYKYNYDDSTWELVNPGNVSIINQTYIIAIPGAVNQDAYSVQVEDNRGIIVSAFYSQESVTSGIPHYTYSFGWNATGMEHIYDSLSTDTMVIEVLQNGTLRWLGQNLTSATQAKPIPPIPVKALHVSMTRGVDTQEVPFQVEDWASNYQIPLGLASNSSLFNNNKMVVFLVDHNVDNVTLWWDGQDIANQTSYAWDNIYFTDNVVNSKNAMLSTDFLSLNVRIDSYPTFKVISTNGSSSSTAEFLRINGRKPGYWADPAYVIHNGIVRDIIQQEAEWNSTGIPSCPNMYSQIVLTFPAKATYYTYALRTIFVTNATRNLYDLSLLQLSVDPAGSATGECITEDGIELTGLPTVSYLEAAYNSSIEWKHHWTEFKTSNNGAGIMFTNGSNSKLYTFDSIAETETGALVVDKQTSNTTGYIEVNPVHLASAEFDYPLDVTWCGAVVTFDGEPIYRSSDSVGLWVMVEYPPSVTVN